MRFFISTDGRGHFVLPKEATQYLRAFGYPEKGDMMMFLDQLQRAVFSRSSSEPDEEMVYRPEWKPTQTVNKPDSGKKISEGKNNSKQK